MTLYVMAHPDLPEGGRSVVLDEAFPVFEGRGWVLVGEISDPSRDPLLTDDEHQAALAKADADARAAAAEAAAAEEQAPADAEADAHAGGEQTDPSTPDAATQP